MHPSKAHVIVLTYTSQVPGLRTFSHRLGNKLL